MLFVVASIEDPPAELAGRGDEITINFPWGSLLRGIVCAEPRVLTGIAALARPRAAVHVLTSVEERDVASGVTRADLMSLPSRAGLFEEAGLVLERCTAATPGEVSGSGSTWGKRLARPALRIGLRRC